MAPRANSGGDGGGVATYLSHWGPYIEDVRTRRGRGSPKADKVREIA